MAGSQHPPADHPDCHERERGILIDRIAQWLDRGIRFFLYVLIFWLPYSKAVIESCVISALILWLTKRIFFSRPFSLKPESSPLNIPILAFLIVCFFSVLGSAFWEQSWHGLITKTLEWFVIYFLVLEAFRERRHVVVALGIFLFTSLATSIDAIVQYYWIGSDIFSGHPLVTGRATAGFGHPNGLGGYLAFVVSLSLVLLTVPRARAWGTAVLAVSVWALILTFSRAAWAATAIGFFLYLGLRFRARLSLFLGGAAVLAVILAGMFVLSPARVQTRYRLDHDRLMQAGGWRGELWEDTVRMIADRPLLGHGLNTYMVLFQEYRRGRPAQGKAGRDLSPTYAHNSYLQLAAETGLLGLAAFLWIIVRLLRPGERSPLQLALLVGIVVMLVHNLMDCHLYSLQSSALLWLMIGILSSLDKLLRNTPNCGIKMR